MTLRELGNSIVQFVVDVYFHFYDTLVKVKKVHSLDLEIKDIFMCLKKLKIREKRKSNIKYKLGKWELWREY